MKRAAPLNLPSDNENDQVQQMAKVWILMQNTSMKEKMNIFHNQNYNKHQIMLVSYDSITNVFELICSCMTFTSYVHIYLPRKHYILLINKNFCIKVENCPGIQESKWTGESCTPIILLVHDVMQ